MAGDNDIVDYFFALVSLYFLVFAYSVEYKLMILLTAKVDAYEEQMIPYLLAY